MGIGGMAMMMGASGPVGIGIGLAAGVGTALSKMMDPMPALQKDLEKTTEKLTNFSSKKIAALVGNTLDCESIFAFKSFLDELKIDNYDCRQDNSYFDPTNRSSYLFNSAIKGIDESDLCFLVGTDIKKEAPILSSRIRQRYLLSPKSYKIFRVSKDFESNFDNKLLGESSASLKILNEKKIKETFKKASKPMFIIGQGAMCHQDAESIYHFCLNFYGKVSKHPSWNGFNVLQTYSGRVGALDLKFYNKKLNLKTISTLVMANIENQNCNSFQK